MPDKNTSWGAGAGELCHRRVTDASAADTRAGCLVNDASFDSIILLKICKSFPERFQSFEEFRRKSVSLLQVLASSRKQSQYNAGHATIADASRQLSVRQT